MFKQMHSLVTYFLFLVFTFGQVWKVESPECVTSNICKSSSSRLDWIHSILGVYGRSFPFPTCKMLLVQRSDQLLPLSSAACHGARHISTVLLGCRWLKITTEFWRALERPPADWRCRSGRPANTWLILTTRLQAAHGFGQAEKVWNCQYGNTPPYFL